MHKVSGVTLGMTNTMSLDSVIQRWMGEYIAPIEDLGVDVAKETLGVFFCPSGVTDK